MYTLGGNCLHWLGDKYAYSMWDLAFHWRVVQILHICTVGFGSWVRVHIRIDNLFVGGIFIPWWYDWMQAIVCFRYSVGQNISHEMGWWNLAGALAAIIRFGRCPGHACGAQILCYF